MRHQLVICDKDKFACEGELIFFYALENVDSLAQSAIKIDANQTDKVYAIKFADFLAFGYTLPSTIVFRPFRQLIAYLMPERANQLSKAMQLLRFRDDHQFCSRCGTATHLHPKENATICPSCHYHQYPRIQPCIITAIVKNHGNQPQILLAYHQRAKDSHMYTVIAGFVEVGESLEQCLHREVREEVGLTVGKIHYMSSQPWPFPSNLMIGFIAEYKDGTIAIDESELIDAQFFDIASLGKDGSPITPPKGTIAYELIEWVKQNYHPIS